MQKQFPQSLEAHLSQSQACGDHLSALARMMEVKLNQDIPEVESMLDLEIWAQLDTSDWLSAMIHPGQLFPMQV